MAYVATTVMFFLGSIVPALQLCTAQVSPCCFEQMEQVCCGQKPHGDKCFCTSDEQTQPVLESQREIDKPVLYYPGAGEMLPRLDWVRTRTQGRGEYLANVDYHSVICVFLC